MDGVGLGLRQEDADIAAVSVVLGYAVLTVEQTVVDGATTVGMADDSVLSQ